MISVTIKYIVLDDQVTKKPQKYQEMYRLVVVFFQFFHTILQKGGILQRKYEKCWLTCIVF